MVPTWPRQAFPTVSVDNTRAEAPIDALPKPLINLNAEYIQMLVEKTVKSAATDIVRHERNSMFFRPNDESATGARRNPPSKHPMKKEVAGRPLMIELTHSSDHSDMKNAYAGLSHSHAVLGSRQMLEPELQSSVLR